MPPTDLTRIGARAEAELFYQFGAVAPASAAEALGITVGRIGDGVVLSVRRDPMGGFWNKAIGFGLTEPVTDRLVTEILDFHRRHGSPSAQLQITPEVLPDNWAEIIAAHGLTPGGVLVKFAGEAASVKPATTDLRVGRIGERDIDEWAALTIEVFAGPHEHLAALLAATARTDSFQGFAAWDGDQMVGAANLFLYGETAHLNSGVTRKSHRNRGVQSALIAARAEYAVAAGHRWLVSEVAKPAVEGGNPSLNNMVRAGLIQQYDRTTWIWRPESAAEQG
ncbi:GNAT family N-acetyltransferase [Plantactinospora sp. S1510]|uniref:GNAT family N-acetyltransferase n=1 Tax=Plantactinospora alkalitolerans TaxID=2789879 RepID=A0ABS0GZQ1_9ACTN|nr:GNAT family N-acetyltransferase [Plantactinospora alkalitolerans]MBF9131352.1 GNAT family N-acetyltransferase [Plantactinospora alkalitolerans]